MPPFSGGAQQDNQAKYCEQPASGTCKPRLDLKAPRRAAQTPLTEVLAVVGQQPIAIFPHAGSCPAHDFSSVEVGLRVRSHPHAPSAREMSERNFFHRSSAQTVREPRIVNDLASANVDAVMQIAAPGCDEVRAQRRFEVPDQKPVAETNIMITSSAEHAHGSVTATYVYALPTVAQAARSRTLW